MDDPVGVGWGGMVRRVVKERESIASFEIASACTYACGTCLWRAETAHTILGGSGRVVRAFFLRRPLFGNDKKEWRGGLATAHDASLSLTTPQKNNPRRKHCCSCPLLTCSGPRHVQKCVCSLAHAFVRSRKLLFLNLLCFHQRLLRYERKPRAPKSLRRRQGLVVPS